MAGFRLEGLSGRLNEVDSTSNLDIQLPVNNQIGMMGIGGIAHDGAAGASRVVRPIDISINRRVCVGLDSLFFQDIFGYNAQNSSIWQLATTGAGTVTWGGADGMLNLNANNTVGDTSTQLTTYKMFQLYCGAGLLLEFIGNIPNLSDSHTTIEFGWFQATGITAPADGVLFRITNNVFYGVININGVETTIDLGTLPNTSVHKFLIKIYEDEAEFWVDDILRGIVETPNTNACMPVSMNYQPICVRTIGTSGGSYAASFNLGQLSLYMIDITTYRPWPQVMAGMGLMGSQWQSNVITAGSFVIGTNYIIITTGSTTYTTIGAANNNPGTFFVATGVGSGTGTACAVGSTAYMANNLAVGAGLVLANATQTTYVGLGGQFDIQPTLAANNDGILCYFQCPPGLPTVPGKALVITSIRVQGVVTTVLANAAAILLQYSLAYGSTALSLATAEAATTKAYRRLAIGQENYGGGTNVAVGVLGNANGPLLLIPASPIVVQPAEYVAIAVKNIGTVTTSGVITVVVTIDAHWE